MIGSLRGVLLDRPGSDQVLVEVNGVGYRVLVPVSTMAGLGELGSQVFLHVHTHVREDAIILYGFVNREQRQAFESLIGAHGVGPSLAIAILSVHSPLELSRAVACDDIDALTLVPGVGRKTAVRLLVELKARLDLPEIDGLPGGFTTVPTPRAEVSAALGGLGYGPDEVRSALRALPEEGATEELLKVALRELAATR
ncbi:MAG: Holliday junction branch migration protein RuvA [Acidimicrobiales bacterium]